MPAPRSLSQIGDVRERGASFEEWGGVEGGIRNVEMRNGMCRDASKWSCVEGDR